jgi:hypothetical protein
MTLKFYRNKRHEVTLRITSENDFHLAWIYKAPQLYTIRMDSLLLS